MDNLDPKMKTADAVAGLSANKRKLFALMLERKRADKRERQDIPPRPKDRPIPLSFAQRGLWLLDRLGESSAYHLLLPIQFSGRIATRALDRAMNEIVRRHEILRTVFGEKDGEPCQEIHPHRHHRLPRIDLSCLEETERTRGLEQCALGLARLAFDLERGPMWRAMVVTISGDKHAFLLSMHHIVSDGWSNEVLLRELSGLYDSFCRNRRSPLPELKAQYADFSVWQHRNLSGGEYQGHLAYWKKQLAGAPAFIDLIPDRPRPARLNQVGDYCRFPLDASLVRGLRDIARQEQGTAFMVVLAAYATMLKGYCGQADIPVGSPVANRHLPWTEPLIGFLVNTVVLRCDLSGNPTFSQLIRRVRKTTLDAYRHQDPPFEVLVEHLRPQRDPSRPPLFQTTMVLQNNGPLDDHLRKMGMCWLSLRPPDAQFELSLALDLNDTIGFKGHFCYNTDLFNRTTISRMATQFSKLLRLVVTNPGLPLSSYSLISEPQRQGLLLEWAGQSRTFYLRECLSQRFGKWAQRCPDRIALTRDTLDEPDRSVESDPVVEQLSYGALRARAGRLANLLRGRGVRPGMFVGLCCRRSHDLVAAILAIHEIGAAYVPLDPTNPDERLAFIARNARLSHVLVQTGLAKSGAFPGCQCIPLPLALTECTVPPKKQGGYDDPGLPAYLIYTSGSTGRPKGVVVPHACVTRLLETGAGLFQFGPEDIWTLFHSYAFDFSVWELWGALLHGGRLVVPSLETVRSPEVFFRLMLRQGITVLNQTPSAFLALQRVACASHAAQARNLRLVVFGGETLVPPRLRPWIERYGESTRLINMYGITETCVHVTYHEISATDLLEERSPIGRPLEDLAAYLLDDRGNPVPQGAQGEITVAGSGLAHGYLNRPALTAQRFPPNPFASIPGTRMYRSGDLARYEGRGRLVFRGRADRQVKIRGYRIEPAEIETWLCDFEGVSEATVVPVQAPDGNSILAAYLVGESGMDPPDPTTIRTALARQLPDYLMPASIEVLDRLPLTDSGKLDVNALPEPASRSAEVKSPQEPDAEILAGIWSELLGREKVGLGDNFFELGGHSLLAARLVSRIREIFGIELSLGQVFNAPTLSGLASNLEKARGRGRSNDYQPIQAVPRKSFLPLSFAQQRLWFLDQLEGPSPTYNIALAFFMKGMLSVATVEAALFEMTVRHEVLRTTFTEKGGQAAQIIGNALHSAITYVALFGLPRPIGASRVRILAQAAALKPFHLHRGPLFRVTLMATGHDEHLVQLTVHHIISDAWSLDIMIREFSALYEGILTDSPPVLNELPIQYGDYAVWNRQMISGPLLEERLAFWKEYLSGIPAVLDLPLDRPRPEIQRYQGAEVPFQTDYNLLVGLRKLSRQAGVTLYMALHAAFAALLWRVSGQEDVVTGSLHANRVRSEIEPLIGFFVNTLPVRFDLSGNPSFLTLLGRVRGTFLEIYRHQDLPFELLVEKLQLRRSLERTPFFQVLFVLQNAPLGTLSLPGIALEPLLLPSQVAHFDLTITLSETPTGLSGRMLYNLDILERDSVELLLDYFRKLLEGIVLNEREPLLDLVLERPGHGLNIPPPEGDEIFNFGF